MNVTKLELDPYERAAVENINLVTHARERWLYPFVNRLEVLRAAGVRSIASGFESPFLSCHGRHH